MSPGRTRQAERSSLKDWLRGQRCLRKVLKAIHPLAPQRHLANLEQWIRRGVHEPDFLIFDGLKKTRGLFLDIGANRGNSALSVLNRTSAMRVLSLEPNTALRWSLVLVWLLNPRRFRFRLVGAGDSKNKGWLSVPLGYGVDLSSQASMDPDELGKDYVRERLGDEGGYGRVATRRVVIVPVDDLELAPDVVKIDVEGWEQQVLNGMHRTLQQHKPVLIIELNNRERWLGGLEQAGYEFFHYEVSDGLLHRGDLPASALNVFCIHREALSPVSQDIRKLLAPV